MSCKIVCFGDSNTYGYDPRSYLGGRYPESVRWTGLLKAAGWDVWNEGENGCSIPRLSEEFQAVIQIVSRAEAQMLTVMLGSNDLLQRPGLLAEVLEERMNRFLTVLLADGPSRLKILLIAPPPMRLGEWAPDKRLIEESRQLADHYKTLAKRLGIYFADAGTWDIDLTFDGVHFSELGHRTFAGEMQKTLEQIMPANSEPYRSVL